jgi:glycosyltransferase involved in cell wall biosynthesis
LRILHTAATYWPSVDGVSMVVQKLSEGLAARGHEVTVATAGPARESAMRNGVRIERFPILGNEVLGMTGETTDYQRFIGEIDCDVMMNYAAQVWSSDLVFPLLAGLRCVKVLAPCGFSMLRDERFQGYFAAMPEVMSRYDAVVVHSSCYQDAAFAFEHAVCSTVVIGNGAAEDEFADVPRGFRQRFGIREQMLFVSIGGLIPTKGHHTVLRAFAASGVRDAALVFLGQEVSRYATGVLVTAPGPLYTLRRRANVAWYELIDRHLSIRRGHIARRVSCAASVHVVLGPSRETVLQAYGDADILLLGSQVECAPLVVYEAMAAGIPFISTRVGNVPELPGGVVVDDEDGMALEIRRLAQDAGLRRRLGEEGRCAWEAEYTWARIVDRYEALYRDLDTRLGVAR